MKHVPIFRWVVLLGLVLIGCSVAGYLATPDYPERETVDLTVLHEEPDGTCEVRWTDPYDGAEHTGSYRCDPYRSARLKAPAYEPGTDLGWDVGYVLAEGPHKGDLSSLDEDEDIEASIEATDGLLAVGLLVTIVGLVGGNIRSVSRLYGMSPGVLRRARRLRGAAARVAEDHARAEASVREAWAPLHEELVRERLARLPVTRLRTTYRRRLPTKRLTDGGIRSVRDVLEAGAWGVAHAAGVGRHEGERAWAAARQTADLVARDAVVRLDADGTGPRTAALLRALRVLVEAGPGARGAAEAGGRLAATLDRKLADAAPAAGWKHMLRAGREERARMPAAVAELRALLATAEREGLAERFAQASVDLLRGGDHDPEGISARVDFDTRPAAYYTLLASVVATARSGPAGSGGGHPGP
ncbi:hypothetical protein [Streptomyces sp. CoH17]|uniref:hypothetical protein n=1 Tax=Streptomyces sp. CoH17 TaxID=2992806 RepID=UPI00226F44DB|nr:hypothetical protein [Streptomyces sp. CoH17]